MSVDGAKAIDRLLVNLRRSTRGFTNFSKADCDLAIAEISDLRLQANRVDALARRLSELAVRGLPLSADEVRFQAEELPITPER